MPEKIGLLYLLCRFQGIVKVLLWCTFFVVPLSKRRLSFDMWSQSIWKREVSRVIGKKVKVAKMSLMQKHFVLHPNLMRYNPFV